MKGLFLGQAQFAEAISEVSDDTRNYLHGDGTSKYYHSFQNFQITIASDCQLSF